MLRGLIDMVNGPQGTGDRNSTSSPSDASEKPKDFFLKQIQIQ